MLTSNLSRWPPIEFSTKPGGSRALPPVTQQFSFCQVGRARHSVRAGPGVPASERRARSDAPYPATHPHNENCYL